MNGTSNLEKDKNKQAQHNLINFLKLMKKKTASSFKQFLSESDQGSSIKSGQRKSKLKKTTSIETRESIALLDEDETTLTNKYKTNPRFKAKVDNFMKKIERKSQKSIQVEQDSDEEEEVQTSENPQTLIHLRRLEKAKEQKHMENCSRLISSNKDY